jgi:hypothetical protein
MVNVTVTFQATQVECDTWIGQWFARKGTWIITYNGQFIEVVQNIYNDHKYKCLSENSMSVKA